jgi:NADPH-dependent 2,4-dienoyl-CoA reductase/sulfur reductase-like enzyme
LRGYCAVNPRTGREYEKPAPPRARKRVAVVGAGPAGIEAALTAAERGHSVVLYEKALEIGGQLAAAARLPFKSTLPRLLSYYSLALEEAGVRVQLGIEAEPGSVDADAVVLATGARWVGSRRELDPLTPLRDLSTVGARVAVIGAGTLGAEIAWWLGLQGRRVTLVERDAEFDDEVNLIQRLVLPQELAAAGVTVRFNTEYAGDIDADTVVLACGAKPHLPKGLEAWRRSGRELHLAGECGGSRLLIGATFSGYRAAQRI